MIKKDIFLNTQFLGSFPSHEGLPEDIGSEIAFCGRSNSGKSSVINALTNNKKMAKTSKTPGRTQSINAFSLGDRLDLRLIDLPGYGYAKVSKAMRSEWGDIISKYLNSRKSLKGLMLIMDIRHPFKDSDQMLIDWCDETATPFLVLLNKSDKLSRNKINLSLNEANKRLENCKNPFHLLPFSAANRSGTEQAGFILENFLGT